MANFATNGYLVSGLNDIKIRLYPQVLGIYKIHEHNLCNALRDFGLMLKSDCRTQLLKYNYEFLRFVYLMRSSEICMIAHGYSTLKLRDMDWWEKFIEISSEAIYDMDGKEIGGFLYSLSRVYTKKNYLIDKLFEESMSWLNMYNPLSVSLLIKSSSHFKCGPEIIKSLNNRVVELADEMNIIDIIFFLTSNVESRTHDINMFRLIAIKLIERHKDIELHHLRAIASSISVAGFKSHILFNILTLRLKELYQTGNKLSETDVVSLLLSFTTQRFLHNNDLCIDTKIYENYLKENPTKSKNIFMFPLPEFGSILAESISKNKTRIQPHGIPIVIRAISMLKIPIDNDLKEYLIDKTVEYIDKDSFSGVKLSNLVVSFAKFTPKCTKFWESVHGALTRQENLQFSGNTLSKMINTISNIGEENISKCKELSKVYDILLQKCQGSTDSMGSRSILTLNRMLSLNLNFDLLLSDDYLDAINKNVDQFSKSYLVKVLKCYVDCVDNIKSKDKFLKFLKSAEAKLDDNKGNSYHDNEIRQLIKMFMSKINK